MHIVYTLITIHIVYTLITIHICVPGFPTSYINVFFVSNSLSREVVVYIGGMGV